MYSGVLIEIEGQTRIVSITRDISERKQAEEELIKSESKYRQLVQTASDAIYLISKDGKVLDFNPAACSMLGRTNEEILNLDISEIDPEFTVEEFLDFWKDIPFGKPQLFETKHQRKDGSFIPVEVNGQKFKIGENTFYYGIIRDIAERKKAEKALVESERKWRNIPVNTPQIAVAIDSQAGIVFANQHFLKLTGWKEDEIIGRDWFHMFIPKDISEEIRRVFHTTKSRKETLDFSTYENVILTISGDLLNVAWANVVNRDAGGDVMGITCLGVDATERVRAEKEMIKQRRLFETMFNTIPDGVVITDTERIIQLANCGMTSTFGYKPEDLLGKSTKILYADPNKYQKTGEALFGEKAKVRKICILPAIGIRPDENFPGKPLEQNCSMKITNGSAI